MEENDTIKTILVVEDDAAIGEVLLGAFQDATPYQIVLASDGVEALKLIEAVKPTLCVLDYNLPHMNGIQLYDRIRTIPGLEEVRALIMSANLPHDELKKRHLQGISKPFDLEDFLQTIEKLSD